MIKKIFVLDLMERRSLFLREVNRRYPDRPDILLLARDFLQVCTNQVFGPSYYFGNYIELIAFI